MEPQNTQKDAEFLYRQESYAIRGACLGLLLNFGHYPQIQIERMARSC